MELLNLFCTEYNDRDANGEVGEHPYKIKSFISGAKIPLNHPSIQPWLESKLSITERLSRGPVSFAEFSKTEDCSYDCCDLKEEDGDYIKRGALMRGTPFLHLTAERAESNTSVDDFHGRIIHVFGYAGGMFPMLMVSTSESKFLDSKAIYTYIKNRLKDWMEEYNPQFYKDLTLETVEEAMKAAGDNEGAPADLFSDSYGYGVLYVTTPEKV